jgi:hypothetical protein
MPANTELVKGAASADRPSPIVLDLGKHKRKSVKRLRNGKGKLIDEALESVLELQRVGTIPQTAQPVFLIVREKPESNLLSILGAK